LKAELRFFVWLGVATVLSAVTAPNFIPLFNEMLGEQFGDVFPVFPFAALVVLITALRWRELKEVLEAEKGLESEQRIRVLGVAIIVALALLEPLTGQYVTTAGVAMVLTFYAVSLVLNPLTKRLMLPYAAVFAAGVGSPAILQWAFGEPLAVVSTVFSAKLVALIGFPVAWAGTQFQFASKSGDMISGFIAPGCSSIISVTTFLGLLALMHLDLKKDLRSTTTLAVAGVGVLTVLNSVRIAVLMWVGYVQGAGAFWEVHNWVGYALFLGFYLAMLPIYSRMGRGGGAAYPVKTGIPYTPS
jgi:exosortase/archaeosortase family protein